LPDLCHLHRREDVTLRLETILRQAGFRVVVLRSSVPTEKREDWYERQLQAGVEVVVCHPKLVETGLDLWAFPTLYFYETGYSLHTLRQASRRSWRIGQRQPVRVKFVTYAGTMQETCLRLMGKKMLVALMLEGKFSGEGLMALDADEDLMSAMARELVEKAGVGNRRIWSGDNLRRSAANSCLSLLHQSSRKAIRCSTCRTSWLPIRHRIMTASICSNLSGPKSRAHPAGGGGSRAAQPLRLRLRGIANSLYFTTTTIEVIL